MVMWIAAQAFGHWNWNRSPWLHIPSYLMHQRLCWLLDWLYWAPKSCSRHSSEGGIVPTIQGWSEKMHLGEYGGEISSQSLRGLSYDEEKTGRAGPLYMHAVAARSMKGVLALCSCAFASIFQSSLSNAAASQDVNATPSPLYRLGCPEMLGWLLDPRLFPLIPAPPMSHIQRVQV